jgi:hypothetical protein
VAIEKTFGGMALDEGEEGGAELDLDGSGRWSSPPELDKSIKDGVPELRDSVSLCTEGLRAG